MVNIEVKRNVAGKITSCQISGHAEAGEKGSDIVCAGVSAISQTALLGLLKHLNSKVSYKMQAGNMYFSLQEVPDEKTDIILETMLLGFEEITKAYPQNVIMSIIGGESHV